METWKDIHGFPGYQVSNKGRVRTHNKVTKSARFERRCWKDRILKQKVSKDKSCRVSLWANGKEHTVLVHRLVAVAFLGNGLKTRLTVNHKDGNRLNNTLENLEWMTLGDNIRDGFRTGLYARNQIRCTLSPLNGAKPIKFPSLSAADRYLGKSIGYCSDVLIKKRLCYSDDGQPFFITKE